MQPPSTPLSGTDPPGPTDAVPLPDFHALPDLIAGHARARPADPALIDAQARLDYAALDAAVNRVAVALQRDGAGPGGTVAICAAASNAYLVVFLGALRAGLAVAPLAPGGTPAQIAGMAVDSDAHHLFLDAASAQAVSAALTGAAVRRIRIDDSGGGKDSPGAGDDDTRSDTGSDAVTDTGSDGDRTLADWLAPPGTRPAPVAIQPDWPFNIIYSSGTTGTPKGIVQPHAMRWSQVRRAADSGYGPGKVTLVATPLYSNTTLVVVVPALARGGCVVTMPKFDCATYLALAERHRATHTMLVPVQYQRLMQWPGFDRHDLSAFEFKACTSAPFHAELKAEVLRRWPGGLTEYYGMTEGGVSCILPCHRHPDKLHTVGRPAEQHDLRLIDEDGRELPRSPASVGEIVGRSPAMMLGYHGRPDQTAAATWHDAAGQRFIRTGDIGRFDADGFLILLDRRKDLIISGGFNVFPSDLEAELRAHPAVADVAVVGVPSAEWSETPVAFVVRRAGHADAPDALRAWLNARVGKTQRLADLRLVDELPRSAIGKVLKRTLRDGYLP